MDTKIKEIRELKRMQEELAAELDALVDEVKQYMDAEGVDTISGTDWKVTYKAVAEAVIEADATHDPETMYLIQIMEKTGKVEKVGGGVKAQTYKAIMEKRSTKWAARAHSVKHFTAKFADWFEIV